MSRIKIRRNARTRINNEWRSIAISKLSELGITFDNQPKNAVLEYLIKEHKVNIVSIDDLRADEKQRRLAQRENEQPNESTKQKTTVSVLLNSDKQGYTVKIVPAVEHKNKEPIKEITKNHISTLSNKQWRNLAKRELAKVGITFAKTVTNLVLEQKVIENKIKNVPSWTSKKEITKKPSAQNPNTIKPTGYKQNSKKSEIIDIENFYETWTWKDLRYQAIKKYGRRCMNCGQFPSNDNKIVLNVDHIKPVRKYPELALNIDNLQVLCNDCNQGKGYWDETDFR